MARKSFVDVIDEINRLLKGIELHEGKLLGVGITKEKVEELTNLSNNVVELESEQELLKAKLKEKTEEFYNKYDMVKKFFSNMRKRVKLEVPSIQWQEFGIEDKR